MDWSEKQRPGRVVGAGTRPVCLRSARLQSGISSTVSIEQEILTVLERLIAFDSVSSRSNLPIAAFIADYLASHGIDVMRVPNAEGDKTSLLATLGSARGPGIVLSAHTDVVPVEGQNWSRPPFEATRREGRIVGRGATDMKGFLALALAHAPRLRDAATATPVHLAFSYDEEVGCRGAPDLAKALASLPVRPALCIVGEPTGLKVIRAHKGKVARRLTIKGRGGHSSLPHRAANAVDAAATLAVGLRAIASELAAGPFTEGFDPPWTTLHIGSLHGGTALNLVPDAATLEFEIRSVPGTDVAALLARIDTLVERENQALQKLAPEAGITVETMLSYPALDTPAASAEAATVARLGGDTNPPGAVSFGTEAGIYAQAGIPTLVCGPGDIGRAHKADEWIGIDELMAGSRMLDRLAEQLGRPAGEWIKA